jgi:hypothetical protein
MLLQSEQSKHTCATGLASVLARLVDSLVDEISPTCRLLPVPLHACSCHPGRLPAAPHEPVRHRPARAAG